MIDPNTFYTKNDLPDDNIKHSMWNSIRQSIFPTGRTKSFVFERRSFAYGMAASFVLMFTCIGIYSTVVRIIEVAQPQEIRMESAYQKAIREFENVALSYDSHRISPGENSLTAVKTIQLRYLNNAIDELKQETKSNDLSPLKRLRLHELYNMKLKLLQEMIQQGDIES
ncbi:MAG: hypothetical protein HYV29_06280 [Ignavibacteriales bacterium]|nr:hypothetical protein [Ignavibacteriales bacterium]